MSHRIHKTAATATVKILINSSLKYRGAWGSVVVRRYATSWMVPGSIPSDVTGFFSGIFPSDHTMALGSTQPLVKMSTRNIPGGKGGRCVRLTSPPSCAECHEIWESKPPGTLWATLGVLWDSFTFTFFEIQGLQLFENDKKSTLALSRRDIILLCKSGSIF